jgi:hypothetical protein
MRDSLNQAMRRALQPGAGHIMPGVANALAARVVEASGYRMMMVSGAAVANTYLGVPDLGLVSVTELAGHVAAIRDVVNIPMLVDADTGFGNAINARRTVKLLERAGANADHARGPDRIRSAAGHFEGKDVGAEGRRWSRSSRRPVDARVDPDLMILARHRRRARSKASRPALDRAPRLPGGRRRLPLRRAPLTEDELARDSARSAPDPPLQHGDRRQDAAPSARGAREGGLLGDLLCRTRRCRLRSSPMQECSVT